MFALYSFVYSSILSFSPPPHPSPPRRYLDKTCAQCLVSSAGTSQRRVLKKIRHMLQQALGFKARLSAFVERVAGERGDTTTRLRLEDAKLGTQLRSERADFRASVRFLLHILLRRAAGGAAPHLLDCYLRLDCSRYYLTTAEEGKIRGVA